MHRRLIVAGVTAFALTPGVALACTGGGHGGPPGARGATGATGVWGATGATGASGTTSASVRQAHFRGAHHPRTRTSAGRG